MKTLAISAPESDLEAQVDPRCGRAPYFLLVNPESMEYEVLLNEQSMRTAQGAGIQAAAMVAWQQPASGPNVTRSWEMMQDTKKLGGILKKMPYLLIEFPKFP